MYIVPSTGKMLQYELPKVAVLKRSVKEAIRAPFVKRPTHTLLSVKSQQKRNA